MQTHFEKCHTLNGQLQLDTKVNELESVTDWNEGRCCPFGCDGTWYSAESFEEHSSSSLFKHMVEMNTRVEKLEASLALRISSLSHAQLEFKVMEEIPIELVSGKIQQCASSVDKTLRSEIGQISERLNMLKSKCQLLQTEASQTISTMTMTRKLELCSRKAETYEGMAMVLNVSFDRLLNQVTEIDIQRRKEKEMCEAQEKRIQVSFSY